MEGLVGVPPRGKMEILECIEEEFKKRKKKSKDEGMKLYQKMLILKSMKF
jgi:hypothetical protein